MGEGEGKQRGVWPVHPTMGVGVHNCDETYRMANLQYCMQSAIQPQSAAPAIVCLQHHIVMASLVKYLAINLVAAACYVSFAKAQNLQHIATLLPVALAICSAAAQRCLSRPS